VGHYSSGDGNPDLTDPYVPTPPVYLTRSDGRVERVCEHGIGHTIAVPAHYFEDVSWWVHGCDGCCRTFARRTVEEPNG
jgi:hypothetical protein